MLALEEEPEHAPPVVAADAPPPPPSVDLAVAERTLKSVMAVTPSSSSRDSSPPWTQCAANKSGVFFLTFFSYVLFHACRKSFSAIKGEMSAEQWMHSSVYPDDQQGQMYGLLDTLFMGFYAIGLYIRCAGRVNGALGSRGL